MAKYLLKVSYSAEGIKGVMREGGTARVSAVKGILDSVGGTLESFYFAFGSDDVYVIGDICTHQDISLSEGEVDADTCHIECWKHGSSFSLETGEPDVLPATRPVPVYRAWVDSGEVFVAIEDAEGTCDV